MTVPHTSQLANARCGEARDAQVDMAADEAFIRVAGGGRRHAAGDGAAASGAPTQPQRGTSPWMGQVRWSGPSVGPHVCACVCTVTACALHTTDKCKATPAA